MTNFELELMSAVEAPAGAATGDELAGGFPNFIPTFSKFLLKVKELVTANPEQVDTIIAVAVRVYDLVVAGIPWGLPTAFELLLKAQIREGLEALLRQALAG